LLLLLLSLLLVLLLRRSVILEKVEGGEVLFGTIGGLDLSREPGSVLELRTDPLSLPVSQESGERGRRVEV
jgi:hypothetical protein